MSTATVRTVSAPRWMLWTGWLLSFLVVAQLLSSAWFRATYRTYALAEIVTGYGYPESAIVFIVIAECALVVLYLFPPTSVLAAIVMTGYLGGSPIGRIVGPDAMKFGGWQRLNAEYAKQFGVEAPAWPPNAPKR